MSLIWSSYYTESTPQATALFGSFWWRDVFKLFEKFCQLAIPEVHSGDTVLYWLDQWQILGSHIPLKDRFPCRFSFVIDDKLTVKEILALHSVGSNFHLPLSMQAYRELLQLEHILSPVNLEDQVKDF